MMRNSFRMVPFVITCVASFGLSTTCLWAQPVPSVDAVKNDIDNATQRNSDPFAKTEQKNFGISVGEFLILPELTVGSVYNDNLFRSQTNAKGSWGISVQPQVTVKRDTGIQNTTLSISANETAFFDAEKADRFSGGVNLNHVYEIERGLDLTYQGGIQRQQDFMSAYSATGTGSGVRSVYVQPISYETYASSLDVSKNFNAAFVSGGANVLDYVYENTKTTTGTPLSQSGRDILEYSGHARAGLRFLSDGYAFIQPSVTQYDFKVGNGATGYTILGGVGTDRLSLFRGEIYGGFQDVSRGGGGTGNNNDVSGGRFGGQLSWTPRRDLVVNLNADHSITPSTSLAGSLGGLTRADTVSGQVIYSYTTKVELAGNAGYSDVSYLRTTRKDQTLQFGVDSTYYFTDSVGIRFQYIHTDVNSNQSIYNYTDNTVTLGLHARM